MESVEMKNLKEIKKFYSDIKKHYELLLKKQIYCSSILPLIIICRIKIESLKIPEILKYTKSELDNGKSVVIFVNYNNTLNLLSK